VIMASDPSREQIAAREEVMKCEKEIQSIKAALKRLGNAGNADEANTLDVVLIKVCTRVLLQLFNQLLLLSFFAIYDSLITFHQMSVGRLILLCIPTNRSKDYRSAHSQLCTCNFLVLSKKELSATFMIHSIVILPQRALLFPSVA